MHLLALHYFIHANMSRAFFVDDNEKFTESKHLRSEVLDATTSVGRYYNRADDRLATGKYNPFVVDASDKCYNGYT